MSGIDRLRASLHHAFPKHAPQFKARSLAGPIKPALAYPKIELLARLVTLIARHVGSERRLDTHLLAKALLTRVLCDCRHWVATKILRVAEVLGDDLHDLARDELRRSLRVLVCHDGDGGVKRREEAVVGLECIRVPGVANVRSRCISWRGASMGESAGLERANILYHQASPVVEETYCPSRIQCTPILHRLDSRCGQDAWCRP
jgi:hypothetical protein